MSLLIYGALLDSVPLLAEIRRQNFSAGIRPHLRSRNSDKPDSVRPDLGSGLRLRHMNPASLTTAPYQLNWPSRRTGHRIVDEQKGSGMLSRLCLCRVWQLALQVQTDCATLVYGRGLFESAASRTLHTERAKTNAFQAPERAAIWGFGGAGTNPSRGNARPRERGRGPSVCRQYSYERTGLLVATLLLQSLTA